MPSSRTAFSSSTWSRVLPYSTEPWPLASVAIMPPMVARLDGDSSGAKNRPCGRDRVVELVLHDARLHPRPALCGIDLQDRVHVARQVDHDAAGQRLTVGSRSATARREDHPAEARLARQPGEAHDVGLRCAGRPPPAAGPGRSSCRSQERFGPHGCGSCRPRTRAAATRPGTRRRAKRGVRQPSGSGSCGAAHVIRFVHVSASGKIASDHSKLARQSLLCRHRASQRRSAMATSSFAHAYQDSN